MTRRSRKRSNPFKIGFLILLIGAAVYFNQVVVPTMPPPFVPTPTPTRSPESFINEAKAYFEDGKLSQAVEAYQQAILADPDNPGIHIALARVQVFAGKYEEAKISAENALLLNPNNSMAHALRAWALDYLGDYLEAEAEVKQAIELDPGNAVAYAYYAEILIDKGLFEDIETAIEMSRKAQELAPNSLETHRVRGYVLYATGNYDAAIQEYTAALAINDKIWDLHYSLGVVYKFEEEYDLAVREMLAAFSLNPTEADIPTDISRTYASIGQFGKAIQYAEQALSIDASRPELHGNLGVMLYKNGEYERAIEEFTLAVRGGVLGDGVTVKGLPISPGRVADDYYTFYGWSLLRMNRCAEAVPVFQLILQSIAEDQLAYLNAVEGIRICQETAGTPSPEPEATPTP